MMEKKEIEKTIEMIEMKMIASIDKPPIGCYAPSEIYRVEIEKLVAKLKANSGSILVIESVESEGTEWGISFTNHNPEAKDYFKMIDSDTAFRLKKYLENLLQ